MSSADAYNTFSRYYDAYVGTFDADLTLYQRLCRGRSRILEVGCGSGRVLPTLLASGAHVLGLDSSAQMLMLASSHLRNLPSSGRLSLSLGDIRTFRTPIKFDLILLTFYTFNYLLRGSDQRHALKAIRLALAPGGLVCFDLFYPYILAAPALAGVWMSTTLAGRNDTIATRCRCQMAGSIEFRDMTFASRSHFDVMRTRRRFVKRNQMQRLLSSAGFLQVSFAEHYNLDTLTSEPSLTSRGFVAVASVQATSILRTF